MKLDGIVVVWTHGDGPSAPFTVAHDEMPTRIVWSADGKVLWTAPGAGPWSAWDPERGECLRRSYLPEETRVAFPLPEMVDLVLGPVVRGNQRDRVIVAWSPDGSRALTVRVHRAGLTLRAGDGSVLRELEGCHRPAAFSPDGTRIACMMHGQDPLVVLGVEDGAPIHSLRGRPAPYGGPRRPRRGRRVPWLGRERPPRFPRRRDRRRDRSRAPAVGAAGRRRERARACAAPPTGRLRRSPPRRPRWIVRSLRGLAQRHRGPRSRRRERGPLRR